MKDSNYEYCNQSIKRIYLNSTDIKFMIYGLMGLNAYDRIGVAHINNY